MDGFQLLNTAYSVEYGTKRDLLLIVEHNHMGLYNGTTVLKWKMIQRRNTKRMPYSLWNGLIVVLVLLGISSCQVGQQVSSYFTKDTQKEKDYPLYVTDFDSKDYTPELQDESESYISDEVRFRIQYYLLQFSQEENDAQLESYRHGIRIMGKPAIPLLLDALQMTEERVRKEIVRTLGEMGFPEAVEGILPCLHDPSPLVRAEAIAAIEAINSQRANDDILRALGDPDALVRANAARAAGNLKLTQGVPVLRRLLHDSIEDVRGSAAMALARLHSYGSINLIKPLLSDASRDVRQRAIQALRALGVEGLAEVALPNKSEEDDEDEQTTRSKSRYDDLPRSPSRYDILRFEEREDSRKRRVIGVPSRY